MLGVPCPSTAKSDVALAVSWSGPRMSLLLVLLMALSASACFVNDCPNGGKRAAGPVKWWPGKTNPSNVQRKRNSHQIFKSDCIPSASLDGIITAVCDALLRAAEVHKRLKNKTTVELKINITALMETKLTKPWSSKKITYLSKFFVIQFKNGIAVPLDNRILQILTNKEPSPFNKPIVGCCLCNIDMKQRFKELMESKIETSGRKI
ncbi:uncharacterized protein LOC125178278 [Hyalella azteca]|uniref:Uncharacterized protein LOC125178278 n=1 Tax=Hyalella azteca TaxID=294128 RepID=A0A979FM87_HYAAZ|nr:uncharacterized protein LOC125178278 [Hyalella azteca]